MVRLKKTPNFKKWNDSPYTILFGRKVGCITDDDYDKKRKEYRAKQDEIQSKLANLQSADENFYLTAKYILSLANRAGKIFESSEPTVNRQLLKLLLQNCVVNDVTLVPTYRSPFNLFVEGASKKFSMLQVSILRFWRNVRKEIRLVIL